MITDAQTNFLYWADTLPKKYSPFYSRFQGILDACGIEHALLPATKDIWAVDYMPVQVSENSFVQFVYNPDYLRKSEKWRKTISDVDGICHSLNFKPEKSDILIDGGNVIRARDTVVMCDKVFKENPHYQERSLIMQLEKLFEVARIVFIPTDPTDKIGHADGMVRFLNEGTVLINDFSKEDMDFRLRFRLSFHNAGIDFEEIPYNPYGNATGIQANGIYINYLQMEQAIVVPTFGIKEDDIAVRQFEKFFTGQTIKTLDCNDVAKDGGVLNCISWNIRTSQKGLLPPFES